MKAPSKLSIKLIKLMITTILQNRCTLFFKVSRLAVNQTDSHRKRLLKRHTLQMKDTSEPVGSTSLLLSSMN